MLIRTMKEELRKKGHYTGPIDDNITPEFDAAVSSFKGSVGYTPRPFFTGITLEALGLNPQWMDYHPTPWMNEIARYLNRHEVRDNKELSSWLRSDGRTLGDPAKLPWCGDAVETAIKNTLKREPFEGRVRENPYLARNWLEFGEEVKAPVYGAVVVFWRGNKGGMYGHVGFVAGEDLLNGKLLVRGGNQANMVSDAWLSVKSNTGGLLGYRYPQTATRPSMPAPKISSKGQKTTTQLS